jgi:hypothetical protein
MVCVMLHGVDHTLRGSRYGTVRYGTVRYGTVGYGTVQLYRVLYVGTETVRSV